MNVEFINPPTLSTGGFSQVVSISGGGRTLYISGQVAYDPKGNVVGNTLEEQSELCFENLRLALAAAGAEFKHIVKITVFLRDMSTERVKAFRAIRAKHFGDHKPAATIVGAPALVDDALQVEIEAVAVLPGAGHRRPARQGRATCRVRGRAARITGQCACAGPG